MCGCFLCAPHWELGLQPKHVPQLGIKLVTLWFAGHTLALSPLSHTSLRRKSFIGVYLSQTDNCGEAKSQQIEKMLQNMAVLQLILSIRIKGGDVRRVTYNSLVLD